MKKEFRIKHIIRNGFYAMLVAVFFTSCNEHTNNNKCGKWVIKNGSSEWNYGIINDVDSLKFKSKTELDIFIDGSKVTIHSDWIQVARYSNCN